MTGGSGLVTAVRAACTAAVVLLAAVILFYCVLIGVWAFSSAGSPSVSVLSCTSRVWRVPAAQVPTLSYTRGASVSVLRLCDTC